MKLDFQTRIEDSEVSILIITGVARSGKTLVGNVLGSCQNAEHIDEPWLMLAAPVLAANGDLAEPLTASLLNAYTRELFNDRILLRNANFRPEDRSSIWEQKPPTEIFDRLVRLYSRQDVRQYTRENKAVLVLTLTNMVPFAGLFARIWPACRIVHVVRKGLEVADEIVRKGWVSDQQLRQPQSAQPFIEYIDGEGGIFYLPFWVDKDRAGDFINASEAKRALTYWRRLLEMAKPSLDTLKDDGRLYEVHFEGVVERPQEMLDGLIGELGLSKSYMTDGLIGRIYPDEGLGGDAVLEGLDKRDLEQVVDLYRLLALPMEHLLQEIDNKV